MKCPTQNGIVHFIFCVCVVTVFSSCAEERPQIPHPSAEYVVVVNENGEPENILVDQFFKKKEHADGVKILVIDKRKNIKTLVTPEEALKQNPNSGPYFIIKHDDMKRPFDDVPR